MNIGFDLDGIFIDKPPFIPKFIIEALYRKHSNTVLAYRYPAKLEQEIRKLSHRSLFRPLISENIAILSELAKTNTHRRYIISSRFSFLKNETRAILKQYGIDRYFNGSFFNYSDMQPHIFKNEIVKKLRLDRYVDDDLPLLRFLAQENPKTRFYWLNKKESKQLGENLFAITELSQMFR